ncbi:PD-(D/E)XK nuclease family protein [Flavobacteriaceae bacterium F08102]|nr:PD-(D/E)XK nuclease family protein [Flavobacteriaceae bacterium F08102]
MQNFLQQVLQDLKTNKVSFENLTIVLPSKRAGVFLKNYLKQSTANVQMLPIIISLEDYIAELSQLELIDNTALLFEFYTVYKKNATYRIDSFDQFTKWAHILLQDFNEINRHLVDANALFSYMSDVKRIEQLLQDQPLTNLIHNQLKFYEQMPYLFEGLNQRLISRKLAYQGLQYKVAVANIDQFINDTTRQFVFAGFNALNKAEEHIFEKLNAAKKAFFYWDIDQFFLDNNHNAALFIKKYLHKFKQGTQPSWISSNFNKPKKIHITGVPKKIGQVKQVATILAKLEGKEKDFQQTALVLADENLLNPTLNALPKEVDRVNITMGYGISNLPLASFYHVIFNMHLHAKEDQFYFKSVIEVLQYANQFNLIDFNTFSKAIETIKNDNLIYLTASQFKALHPALKPIAFVLNSWKNNCQTSLNCLLKITSMIQLQKTNIIQKEAHHGLISILQTLLNLNETYGYLDSIKVLFHYYQQLLSAEKLSFQGEPLSGLQIMGMLETRALDFKTLIITSVNENILPAGKSNNSFIAFDIKQKFKMPTDIEKNAIFSYHFFRLLQRAEHIHLLYNTEPDDFGSGEQSRFLTQLIFYKKNQLTKQLISPKVYPNPIQLKTFKKDEFSLNKLREKAAKGFSPSALTTYLRNPLDFYKRYVLNIYEDDKVEEFIAANTLGTIIHNSLEQLYKPYIDKVLTKRNLRDIIEKSESVIHHYFKKEHKYGSLTTGKNLLIYHVAKQFVQNFLRLEHKQIQQGRQLKILALEQKIQMSLTVEGLDFPINLMGEIDRVDLYDGTLRIIDYKTGVVEQGDLVLKDWDTLIADDKKSKVFQLLTYALMYRTVHGLNLDETPLTSGILSFKRLKNGLMKVNKANTSEGDLANFEAQLSDLLLKIFNPALPFEEKEQKTLSF